MRSFSCSWNWVVRSSVFLFVTKRKNENLKNEKNHKATRNSLWPVSTFWSTFFFSTGTKEAHILAWHQRSHFPFFLFLFFLFWRHTDFQSVESTDQKLGNQGWASVQPWLVVFRLHNIKIQPSNTIQFLKQVIQEILSRIVHSAPTEHTPLINNFTGDTFNNCHNNSQVKTYTQRRIIHGTTLNLFFKYKQKIQTKNTTNKTILKSFFYNRFFIFDSFENINQLKTQPQKNFTPTSLWS